MALTKVTGSVIKDSVSLSGNVSVGGTLTYQDVTNVDALGIGTFRTGIKVLAGQVDVGSNIKLGNAGVVTATSFVGSGANLTSLPSQVTISSNADNRVITGGSGTNLVGESTLTYNGLQLNISNTVPELFLTDTNSNNSYGRVRGNGGNLILSADVNNATGGSVMVFETDGSEKARIDDSGRLLVGHIITDDRDGYNSALQVSGTGGDDASISIGRWSANSSYPALTLSKSRNGTIGSHTVLVADDYLGGIQFQGDDGSGYHVGASIAARVESGVGNNDMPASLRFNTNQGTTGTTERMLIHGGGNGHNILYGGRVDILGYQGTNITGGTNSNVLNEQFLICPSAASSYDDHHTITFGQTKGDWYQGVNSGYHTSFGLLWNWGGSGGGATRAVRAGIHYDHRAQEKFKIWSSYGDIDIKVDSSQSGNETAETCDTTAMTLTHDGYVTKPVQPGFGASQMNGWTNTTGSTYAVTSYGRVHHNYGSHFNSSNGRFTAPIDGRYLMTAIGMGVPVSNPHIAFGINNSSNGGGPSRGGTNYSNNDMWSHPSNSAYWVCLTHILDLSANDYVRVYTYDWNSSQDAVRCYFYGYLMG